MPKKYKVSTALGEDFEFELVEKSRDLVVLRSKKSGKLFRVKAEYSSDNRLILDINGVKHVVFISGESNIYLDFEKILVTRITTQSVSVESEEEKRVVKRIVEEPGVVTAPIAGRVVEVKVTPGISVREGDLLLLMESMKMIIEIKSLYSGVVEKIYVDKNKSVNKGDPLLKIKIT